MSDDQQKNDELDKLVEQITNNLPEGLSVMSPEELDDVITAGTMIQDQQEAQDREDGKIFLDEERDKDVIDEWIEQALAISTTDELKSFIDHLINDYRHDYGTICHAISAAALAGAYAVENSPTGGITGFQAGAVGWEFWKGWHHITDSYLRMVDYEDLLFPQHDDKFQTISKECHDWLVGKAKELIEQSEDKSYISPAVMSRWKKIAGGWLPEFISVEG